MTTIELQDSAPPAPASSVPALSSVQALILIPVVLVVVAIFMAASAAACSAEFFVGFLFLLYWAGLEHADFKALPGAILGSLFGLILTLLLNVLTGRFGEVNGALGFLVLFLPVMFCQFRVLFPTVVNTAMVLQLMAGAISQVQAHADFRGMFINLAVAVVYFGSLGWVVSKVRARLEAKRLAA